MTIDNLKEGIGSHEAREMDARDRAIRAITKGEYWTAQIALQEAAQHAACSEELQFQIETMEVEDDD